jgi:hypothetical protein
MKKVAHFIIYIVIPVCLLDALAIGFLKKIPRPIEPAMPLTFWGSRLVLPSQSKLWSRLEIIPVEKAAAGKTSLRTVGQIIATANPSGNLVGPRSSWVELSPELLRTAGLRAGEHFPGPVGTCYGLTILPAEYAGRVEKGQPVQIQRYGLKKMEVEGNIWQVQGPHYEHDTLDVVFRFSQGQGWFPGTPCETRFPLLNSRAVEIPSTALVHEGVHEYVWQEDPIGQFLPQMVSVVDGTAEKVWVLGLRAGARIVARGGILLKPELQPLLNHERS